MKVRGGGGWVGYTMGNTQIVQSGIWYVPS